jgi:hypothetical protein
MNEGLPTAYHVYNSGLYGNDTGSTELSSLEAPDEI